MATVRLWLCPRSIDLSIASIASIVRDRKNNIKYRRSFGAVLSISISNTFSSSWLLVVFGGFVCVRRLIFNGKQALFPIFKGKGVALEATLLGLERSSTST